MGRPSTVRYREDRDAWVTVIDGKYRTLARGKRNRAEATRVFHRLKAAQGTMTTGSGELLSATVGDLIDSLLIWIRDNRAPLTLIWYKDRLDSFGQYVGPETSCMALRATDAIRWMETHEWGSSSRHGAVGALKRLGQWAVKHGYLAVDPFASLEKPPMRRREHILSPVEEIRVTDAANQWLRPYLQFLMETGCRPSEGMRIEAKHCDLDGGTATMPGKTTSMTGKSRVIYLTPRALEIVRPLAEKHRVGPLFRNQRGNPWHRHALAQAMGRLRRRLGLGPECTCESFRHGWITEAKLKLPNSIVAELAGHTSTQMIDRFYNHLNERSAELLAATARVRRPGSSASSSPAVAPSSPGDPAQAPPDMSGGNDRNPPR